MGKAILYIALGGASGSVLRYLFQLAFDRSNQGIQPWGIFFANLLGCFLIGIFAATFANKSHLDPTLKLFLITGFCGGFTTFSSYMFHSMEHLEQGQYMNLIVHGLGSIICGYVAVFAGYAIANNLTA